MYGMPAREQQFQHTGWQCNVTCCNACNVK
jgi:hypothetical protein